MNRPQLLKKIILDSGKEILKYYGKKSLKSKTKRHKEDFVTEADLKSEKIILDEIKKYFPNDGIISEESKDQRENSEYLWIIDPLDGTWNFANDIPIFGVIIALARKKEIVAGGVYLPVLNDFYFAEKGKGASRNGRKISCSNKKDFANSRTSGYLEFSGRYNNEIGNLIFSIYKYNYWHTEFGCGAYDTMLVASGRTHCFISAPEGYGGVWDVAAPSIIMKEAGCTVTNFEGKDWSIKDGATMLSANSSIHKEIMGIMKKTVRRK